MDRLIYAYEFSDNSVYVGLTSNPINRKYSHFSNNKSQVNKHKFLTGLNPEYKELTYFLSENDSILRESEYVEKYKHNGWKILNKIKTGNLGGTIVKWTKSKCLDEALKYTSKKIWSRKSSRSYNVALKYGWINECAKHMNRPIVHNKKWTLELCQIEALKYEKRKDWYLKSRSSYVTAVNNKWISLCDQHFYGKYI